MSELSRRDLAAGIATGVLTTGGFIALSTSRTQAATVDVAELSVPDKSVGTSTGIKDAILAVSGEYSWTGDKQVSRAVLRVEIDYNGTTTQLAAQSVSNPQPTDSGTYTLRGSIFSHPDLSAGEVTPGRAGETNDIPLTVRVKLVVSLPNDRITAAATDTATLTVTKKQQQTSVSISGTGDWEVTTEST